MTACEAAKRFLPRMLRSGMMLLSARCLCASEQRRRCYQSNVLMSLTSSPFPVTLYFLEKYPGPPTTTVVYSLPDQCLTAGCDTDP